MVKKKAALTLLRLYRKHPTVIPASEWALRIVAIMDDMDLVNIYNSLKRDMTEYYKGRGELCNKSHNGDGPGSSRCVRRMLSEGC